MKLTLTFVRSEQKISPRTNKPFTSQSIRSTEYGERYLSGFESKETINWKVGDVVEVEVKESDKLDKNGKPYLNWSLPKPESPVMLRLESVEKVIKGMQREIYQIINEVKRLNPNSGLTSAGTKVPDFTPNTPEEAKEFGEKMETYEDANAILNMVSEEELM